MTASKDITGERFGRLVATKRLQSGTNGGARWLCLCDCGSETSTYLSNLASGRTASCGCYNNECRSERKRVHGATGSRMEQGKRRASLLYGVWSSMRGRCNNPTDSSYERYGGRGIAVCLAWDDFRVFEEWALTSGYSHSLSIDRIDNDGPYSPDNCRWATAKTQCRNRRVTPRMTYRGKTASVAEFAEEYGIPYDTLRQRVGRYGWSAERAIEIPRGHKK